jgi:hypothetical protein
MHWLKVQHQGQGDAADVLLEWTCLPATSGALTEVRA